MIAVNLIPSTRRRARSGRRRVRRWACAGIAYGAILGGAYAAVGVAGGARPAGLDATILTVASEIQGAEDLSRKLAAEIEAVEKELAAARSITDHPDWSVLLGLVSGARLGEVVLDRCELWPLAPGESAPFETCPDAGAPAAPKPVAAAGRAYVLKLSGLGRRQRDIPQFVLRLEKIGLFERVTLVDSRSRPLGDGEVFAFRIECSLRDPGGLSR